MRYAGISLALAALLVSGCAHHPADNPSDPLEPVNRVVFKINETADKYALRPIAKGYVYITPAPIRTGIGNFFDNLDEPRNIINALLQGKPLQASKNLGRLVLNSTAGLVGFIDVASEVGLARHEEGFGQTLGYWGVGEGWYLMLPLLGPSTNRDLVGFVVDIPTKPLWYLSGSEDVYTLSATGINLVNTRANYLSADSILEQQFDRYLFVRTAYLQQRWNLIHDGNPPLDDFELPDDESDAPAAAAPDADAPAAKKPAATKKK
ncbi:MlaA family lipoprotein [Nevskia ramosa]|uniref:MlaA family lipoprotein n=1 Tax=Nevskia ramosa TaxID=64002 RepID=UPI003D0F7BEE